MWDVIIKAILGCSLGRGAAKSIVQCQPDVRGAGVHVLEESSD